MQIIRYSCSSCCKGGSCGTGQMSQFTQPQALMMPQQSFMPQEIGLNSFGGLGLNMSQWVQSFFQGGFPQFIG